MWKVSISFTALSRSAMSCMPRRDAKEDHLFVLRLALVRRQREPRVSGSGRTSRTRCASDAEGRPSTFRRRGVLAAPTPPPREESVSKECVFECRRERVFPVDNWSVKAKRRHTTGTGRMKHLRVVQRRFRNGFREGTQAKSQKRRAQKTD